jgi:large subunit ribosomal protein L15
MKLNQLRNRPGSTHTRKLLGRGIGSGLGKTSGRGVKGQKARTGIAIKGFEGGQMPLFRRLPKRGFTSIGRVKYVAVNIGRLQAAVDAGRIDPAQAVTVDVLVDAGVIRRSYEGMRLLGDGELKAKLTIEAMHASETARAAVEKAGGSVKIFMKAPSEHSEKQRAKTRAKKGGKGGNAKAAPAASA